MKQQMLSERAGITAVLMTLCCIVGLAAISVATGESWTAQLAVANRGSTIGFVHRAGVVRMPDLPRWQQKFFNFDSGNSRTTAHLAPNRHV